MSANHSISLHHRLRRLKAALLALSFTLAGILLMMLNAWFAPLQLGSWQWLHALPLGELGGTLFGAGLLSTFFEYTFRRDQERAVTERFRQTIREEAPALRDVVIEAFRFDRQDVARIATPELLDDLARTSLGLRFGDPAFGREVYADIRYQAMAAEERWYDARVDATLGIPRGRSSAPTPFFDLRVRWEYTVTPRHRFRKFAVVSDRQRYDQLVAERGETSVWYRRPVPGLAANDPEVFALEQFTVNGTPVPFSRQVDEVSQVYTVDLGEQVIQQEQAVVVSFSFRTRTLRSGHVVHLDIDRPTRGLDVELRYDPEQVGQMRILDFASIGEGGRLTQVPNTPTLRYRYDGWLFPRAGMVFVWTLPDEQDDWGEVAPDTDARPPRSAGSSENAVKAVPATEDDARQARAA
ncbi:hypothetical protein BKH03_12515 [Actinomyces naeslundii]|uniref:hypothetical protein n=1 Tax=Actinomyces naeslundii TaxID=1655 RepID=UPI00096D32C2|nr:hypothetical protein [Actinomyces naeslundii]MBF1032342.1 hypothetical protein [Candidatus Nanosynbacter sp.]OMG39201.1 hypothetical protein BKH03_12515 [Actinomyces naeslundii]